MSNPDADHAELFKLLHKDRVTCHRLIFPHRHPNITPDFHVEMIHDFHDPKVPKHLDLAFRGSAKSTIIEEGAIIKAGFREFRNGLIIGETYERAAEHLATIKHEIETNEVLADVFGDLIGPTWGDGELVLSNGVRIKAMGRGQAIRGIKYNDMRPDFVMIDDLEDNKSVRTPEGRKNAARWFYTELLPACDVNRHVRMAATPLHIEAIAVGLLADLAWECRIYPICYLDADGVEQATWPDRYNMPWIEAERRTFSSKGLAREFDMEFMCQARSEEEMSFRAEMFFIEPTVRTWHAVYAMFDPARTTNVNSATTGFACWSWIGPRLVVWDGWGKKLMPDQIVEELFRCNEDYRPVLIGFEEDGLNQWGMQPIRQEQVKRGVTLPVRAMRAPKGKLDFIKGLQPFFNAREVRFAKELPELKKQFLNFPTGEIDAPNALAYALKMRPGAPIYDDFGGRNIGEDLRTSAGKPVYLSLNATRSTVTGCLLQLFDGCVRIYADWVREGEPSAVLEGIVREAQVECGRSVRLVGGPLHFDQFNNVGLKQAAARLPMQLDRAGQPADGRPEIRKMLRAEIRGMPALMVSSNARWTLNAFAGGYARALDKQGQLRDHADEGPYRTLMEGLESFGALMKTGSPEDEDHDRNYAEANGRRYMTSRPGR